VPIENGFFIDVFNAHLVDAVYELLDPTLAFNGTDWLAHNTEGPVIFGLVSGGTFRAVSFDVTEYQTTFGTGGRLVASGVRVNGQVVMQEFKTDTLARHFETVTLSQDFTELRLFTLYGYGRMGYDNINFEVRQGRGH
jgi:hypothetical protein